MASPEEDITFTRTDPITVEMEFKVEDGGLQMRGRAYPGCSSGGCFGAGCPKSAKKTVKEQIDEIIKQQTTWLRNFYPRRPLKLRVKRPDVRQLTLAEAV